MPFRLVNEEKRVEQCIKESPEFKLQYDAAMK